MKASLKRAIDILFATFGLVLLAPLYILIGIAIKLDSYGPVFFVQPRLGKDGVNFLMYKFRTMVNNAEKIGSGIFTNSNDPRITKVGRFLRRTSLDELPQLINVIKGDMSIVGPRPPVPYHPRKYEEYTDKQKVRFTVKPGITGYAQVLSRNTISWDERIELDLKYIRDWTLVLDFKIIFLTIGVMANSKAIFNIKE